jgi:hypothetical protein
MDVNQPEPWECDNWEKVKVALEAAGKTSSSYYVMAVEALRLCGRLSRGRQHGQ